MIRLDRLNEEQREDFEERAAIIEYDGKLSRRESEILAWELVTGQALDLFARANFNNG